MVMYNSSLSNLLKRFDNTDSVDSVDYVGFKNLNPYSPYEYTPSSNMDTVDYVGFKNINPMNRIKPIPYNQTSLQNRLFTDPMGTGGPSTRTVEGQGIFTDLNANQVWDQGENYNPASSIWNGWMSQQDAMQNPTAPTTAGLGYVPTTQDQQTAQNMQTQAAYTGTPLTPEEEALYGRQGSVATQTGGLLSLYG